MDASVVLIGGFAALIAAQGGLFLALRRTHQLPPQAPSTASVDPDSFYELKTRVAALERDLADLDGKTDLRLRRIVGTLSAERGSQEVEEPTEESVARTIQGNIVQRSAGQLPQGNSGQPRLVRRS